MVMPATIFMQEELGQLKLLWDTVSAVLHTFHAWSGMPWGTINVEELVEEAKQLTKDIKLLPKGVRQGLGWEPVGLQGIAGGMSQLFSSGGHACSKVLFRVDCAGTQLRSVPPAGGRG